VGREWTSKGEKSCDSHRHAVEDEGAEVAEGSWDTRVGGCPERAQFVP
jgi:uncharacterized cupin superfamily protein